MNHIRSGQYCTEDIDGVPYVSYRDDTFLMKGILYEFRCPYVRKPLRNKKGGHHFHYMYLVLS
jgi:hypothetical protein